MIIAGLARPDGTVDFEPFRPQRFNRYLQVFLDDDGRSIRIDELERCDKINWRI